MAGILSIQFEPILNKMDENLEKIQRIIDNFMETNVDKKPVDLLVLPEFFTTGVSHKYVENPVSPEGGKPIELMANVAKKYNTNIAAGTVITKEGEKLYNTMFVLNREGKTVVKYRKIHLFKYFGGTENERITPGDEILVANLDFARVGLSICFDIKYPLHYRKLMQKGAEIIVSPSAWAFLKSINGQKELNSRIFRCLSITRANENLVYFVTSNQCGNAGILGSTGDSMIISPNAEILADAKDSECAIYANIDLELVRTLKNTTPMAFEE